MKSLLALFIIILIMFAVVFTASCFIDHIRSQKIDFKENIVVSIISTLIGIVVLLFSAI